jgi:hypothetical protein
MKLSPNTAIRVAMTAEQFLSLADALRSYAQHSGRDLNASNLFVHTMLMRSVHAGEPITPRDIVQHTQQLDEAA